MMKWFSSALAASSNYPLDIKQSLEIDIPFVISTISKDFSEFLLHSDVLPGQCCRVVREMSYILFELKIKHTVTIGDIELADGMYVGLSRQKLKKELKQGYQVNHNEHGEPIGMPVDVHAWITLENGQIVDATILPSLHRKNENSSKLLSFEEAIYFSGKNNIPVIKHVPFMTGFAYHALVLTHPIDGTYQTNIQWFREFFDVIDRLDTAIIINS